jgi:hypothetical protein
MVKLEVVKSDSQKDVVKRIITKHHSYVPTYRSVGRRIDWLIFHSDYKNILGIEKPIGMIGIGSSVYPCPKAILEYLGKKADAYREPKHFNTIANNWRFCMTESIKNAGTQILKQLRKQAPIEWKKKYGDELTHIITFVAGGNNGAVYKADNWKQIGKTAGLSKDRKSFSVKWNSAEYLKETFLPPTGENKKLIFITRLKW